jgi:hypothetical protein
MRDKLRREHESTSDIIHFDYKQRLEKHYLKRPEAEVEMPLQLN